jgi:predicted transcriptional regulator
MTMTHINDLEKDNKAVLEALGKIISAYVSNHSVEASSLGNLIQDIYTTLSQLDKNSQKRNAAQAPVTIEDSITPDYLICLEDGKKLKMLKRHLRTSYGLTPERYRERWNLPVDYPMVAPNYAKKRSALAKTNGLGHARSRVYQHPSTAAVG